MPVVVFWLMLRAIHQHPILHLHPNLTIKGKQMMKIVFQTYRLKNRHFEKRLSQSPRNEILLKEVKEEGLFKMDLFQAIKESNKVFADTMSDMSKSFILMAETMKVSLQQMAMINNNNILWYLPINQLVVLIFLRHNKHSKDRYFELFVRVKILFFIMFKRHILINKVT